MLALAFAIESVSWVRALRQLREDTRAEGRSMSGYLRWIDDPTPKTVLFEDSAALTGILLAFAGIGLHHLTGSSLWDGLASIAIGLLLAVVAYLLVCTRVDFVDSLTSGELEQVCVRVAADLRHEFTDVDEVFIEPGPRTAANLRAVALARYGDVSEERGS